jgi:hypothetical protein
MNLKLKRRIGDSYVVALLMAVLATVAYAGQTVYWYLMNRLPKPGFGRRLGAVAAEVINFGLAFVLSCFLIATVKSWITPGTSIAHRTIHQIEQLPWVLVTYVVLAVIGFGLFVVGRAACRGAVQAYDYIWYGLPATRSWWRS